MTDSVAQNGLVLTGGGARAAYQVGVLAYIAEHAPEVRFPILSGVSAGAINAAFLAGHRGPPTVAVDALARAWNELTVDQVFHADPASLGLSGFRWLRTLAAGGLFLGRGARGLVDTEPLREYLISQVDVPGIDMNLRTGRLQALGLTTTCYSTGQTITFVHGRPEIPTWERVQRRGVRTAIGVDHVMASCALPLIFPAVEVDGSFYGDGSIRQAAPLAPAIHMGADRLLAITTRYPRSPREVKADAIEGYPPPAQVLSVLFNAIFLDALEADSERLERINAVIEALPPGAHPPDGLRAIDLLVIRPSLDIGKLAADFQMELPRTVRFLLRNLGAHETKSPDLISYLVFEPKFIQRLFELGYEDAHGEWRRIEGFLAGEDRAA